MDESAFNSANRSAAFTDIFGQRRARRNTPNLSIDPNFRPIDHAEFSRPDGTIREHCQEITVDSNYDSNRPLRSSTNESIARQRTLKNSVFLSNRHRNVDANRYTIPHLEYSGNHPEDECSTNSFVQPSANINTISHFDNKVGQSGQNNSYMRRADSVHDFRGSHNHRNPEYARYRDTQSFYEQNNQYGSYLELQAPYATERGNNHGYSYGNSSDYLVFAQRNEDYRTAMRTSRVRSNPISAYYSPRIDFAKNFKSEVQKMEYYRPGTFKDARQSQTFQDRGRFYSSFSESIKRDVSIRKAQSVTSNTHSIGKRPLVYPALLSEVAAAMLENLPTENKIKDGLTYKNAFLGCEAIDLILYLIKTSDRNLALLLGRALDAQKFIHDVTYDHRLRDSSAEVYQFREQIPQHFGDSLHLSESYDRQRSVSSIENLVEPLSLHQRKPSTDSLKLPVGVFTLLTECYSPTCTRDKLCYSTSCPRRLEQQARLLLKPLNALKRAGSGGSLFGFDEGDKEQKLWIHSVSKEVADTVDEKEKKRQEVICELIYTERDFVKDIEYLHDFWIKPLRSSPAIPEQRRERFIRIVFGNVMEVYSVNSRLAEALTKRQRQSPVVKNVGDVFLEYVPHFDPFIRYGAGQLYGKYEFERERSGNPEFAKFVEETERRKESRKLELNGYLTKPTTRLARYPLLLGAVLKHTRDDNSDKEDIPKVISVIREFLGKVNVESGKAENRFNLYQLNRQLQFKPGEYFNLHLMDSKRELIFKGSLKRRNIGFSSTDSSGDLQLFLFDHALLMVKIKLVAKREQYRVYRKPIPLELLVLTQYEENASNKITTEKRPPSSLLSESAKSELNGVQKDFASNKGYPLTFTHLGRRGYSITTYAPTYIGRKKWAEHIEKQKMLLREKHSVFQNVLVCDSTFVGDNKLHCLCAFDGGRKLVFGTNHGIFVSERKPHTDSKAKPELVLQISNVTQVDIIEQFGILLVLADRILYCYSMDIFDADDASTISSKRGRKVTGHINFFESGVCLGRVLICAVKSSTLSTTIKVFEPVEITKSRKQATIKKFLSGSSEALKVYKELYMPTECTSVHFLKTKLCVGCAKGFEIVNLTSLETQSMLDPADTSLEFVEKRENVKPIAIFRLNGEFLLCYSEFALYVNRHGWRTRSDWFVSWEGVPAKFALSYPYILAFEPSFIEIRHIETAALVQIISGNNIRLLNDGRGILGEGGEILYKCDDRLYPEVGESSIVYSLMIPKSVPKKDAEAGTNHDEKLSTKGEETP